MNQPKVSVIVPIYNAEKYLRECLDPIVNQTLKDIEIILIDDGATDSSPAIVDEYAAKDSRIVPIHKPNGGYASGINYGLGIAKSGYIAIIESDDIAAVDMLESLYEAAEQSQADVVMSDYTYIEDSINKVYRYFNYGGNIRKDEDGYFTLQSSPTIIHKGAYPWHKLYRLSFLNEHHIRMLEDGKGSYQDLPWNAEILSKAKKLYHVPKSLYFYRRDAEGSSINIGKRSMVNYLARRSQARDVLIANGAFTEDVREYFYLSALYGCDFHFQRIHPDFKKEFYDKMQALMRVGLDDGLTFKFFSKGEKKEYQKRVSQSYFRYKLRTLFSSERSPDGRHKIIRFKGHKLFRYNRTPMKFLSIVRLMDRFTKKDPKRIVFYSSPEYSDNSRCFYEYLQKEHPGEWKITWIRRNQNTFVRGDIPSEWEFSWGAMKALVKAKYIVTNTFAEFQHYLVSDKHITLQFWHGMPIKTLGYLEKNVPPGILKLYQRNAKAHFFITSENFRQPMQDCFHMRPDRIHVTGQPRTDRAIKPHNSEKIKEFLGLEGYDKVVAYCTTYKEFKRDGVRDVDKEFNNIFYMDDYDEAAFLKKLSDEKILFLIKPHPLDERFFRRRRREIEQQSENIRIILNGDLNRQGLYFYDFFSYIDVMVSDFSSIAIDYLIQNKPVIYLTNLTEEYGKNRGFIQPDRLDELMPGPHAATFNELVKALDDALHEDSYRARRSESVKRLHAYQDAAASERIYQIMKGL